MRRVLPAALLREIGQLDRAASPLFCDDAWPDVRARRRLHDALLTWIALAVWHQYRHHSRAIVLHAKLQDIRSLPGLRFSGSSSLYRRGGNANVGNETYWVAAERVPVFIAQIFPSAHFEVSLPTVDSPAASRDEALLSLVTGWIAHAGPGHGQPAWKCPLLSPVHDIEKALPAAWSPAAVVLRGQIYRSELGSNRVV